MTNHDIAKAFADMARGAREFKDLKTRHGSLFISRYFGAWTIFSYGVHYPIASINAGKAIWHAKTKYSRTTTKHCSLVRGLLAQKQVEVVH